MSTEVNQRIAKNTLYLYVRTGFTLLVSLYTSRVVFNALGVEDFGIWGVLGGLITMFSFVNQSLSSSIFRYITHAIGLNDNNKLNNVYSISIIIHILLALLIFGLCETFGGWILAEKMVIPIEKQKMAEIVFHIVIVSSSLSLLSVPFNSVIIAYERMNIYAYMTIIDVIFKLIIAFIICQIGSNRLIWYSLMMLFITIFMLVVYIFYVIRNFKELKFKWVYDISLYKSILSFSGWSFCGNIAAVGYNQGLNILLNIFFGPVVNAARGISLQIEQTVRSFVVNFQSAINPQIIKNYAQKEFEQMHILMFRSSKFSVFLLYIFALPIMLETDAILYLWLGQVQHYTVIFIRIMFLVIALETMSNSLMTGVVANGHIRNYQLVVSFILILIVPISYIVLKSGAGAEMVFIIYLIMEILAVIARLYFAKKMVNLDIKQFALYVIIPSVIVILLGSLIPLALHIFIQASYVRSICVILISGLTSCSSIYLFGMTVSERTLINQIIRKKLMR